VVEGRPPTSIPWLPPWAAVRCRGGIRTSVLMLLLLLGSLQAALREEDGDDSHVVIHMGAYLWT